MSLQFYVFGVVWSVSCLDLELDDSTGPRTNSKGSVMGIGGSLQHPVLTAVPTEQEVSRNETCAAYSRASGKIEAI